MSYRVILLAATADALSGLSGALPSGTGLSMQISSQIGGVAELCHTIGREQVDLAVADLRSLADADLGLIEAALAVSPATTLVLVCSDSSADFLLRAMRAGIREIVLPTSPADTLRNALLRQIQRRGSAPVPQPLRKAKALAFVSAKGGGGATFLATNLGFALAARSRKVALFDLNLQFGDAALFVSDQQPARTVADVAREIQRLDQDFLEANMMTPAPGYQLLPAPDTPERAIDVKTETVERLFTLARTRYDYILVDVGRVLDKVTVRALDEVDAVHIVIQSTLPYLHNAKRMIGVLSGLGYERQKIRLLINRYSKSDEITLAEIEKTLGMSVDHQVPNSYAAVAHSINHGRALIDHAPRDPVARALTEIADSMAPEPARRSGASWLKSVFSGS
jgi:pilus assembly protein CpaE